MLHKMKKEICYWLEEQDYHPAWCVSAIKLERKSKREGAPRRWRNVCKAITLCGKDYIW